jgi:hypothetical protein
LTQDGNLLRLVRRLAQFEQTRFWAARIKPRVIRGLWDRGLLISGRHWRLVPVHCRGESVKGINPREKIKDFEEEKSWFAHREKQRQNY